MAVAAARELFRAGLATADAIAKATWQDRVDALGRGHYRRYDERTSTQLGEGAELAIRRWHGDLRELRRAAAGDINQLRSLLMEFPGMGPTAADIFVREVQGVWPEYAPFFDQKVRRGAAKVGLPSSPDELADLVPRDDVPRLASGLVRVALDRRTSADSTRLR